MRVQFFELDRVARALFPTVLVLVLFSKLIVNQKGKRKPHQRNILFLYRSSFQKNSGFNPPSFAYAGSPSDDCDQFTGNDTLMIYRNLQEKYPVQTFCRYIGDKVVFYFDRWRTDDGP
mmetsp:Transcript_587/g.693  ORF Transcript_587/g.693 Transcript_587/m.693 type:complete len:118 (+) Transcript_587:1654-2007(+)